jgi:hypothetical protein
MPNAPVACAAMKIKARPNSRPGESWQGSAAASSSANAARSIEKPSAFAGVPRLSGSMVSAGDVYSCRGWQPARASEVRYGVRRRTTKFAGFIAGDFGFQTAQGRDQPIRRG